MPSGFDDLTLSRDWSFDLGADPVKVRIQNLQHWNSSYLGEGASVLRVWVIVRLFSLSKKMLSLVSRPRLTASGQCLGTIIQS